MIEFEKVLLLILGWLFGLLSPAIVDSIRKRREAKEVKIAIWMELQESQYRLAQTVYFIEMRYGQPNRELVKWIQLTMKEYRGLNSPEDLLNLIESQTSCTDEEFADIAQAMRATPSRGISLTKHSMPLLDSKIASLAWLNATLRNQLLEIKTRIGFINEETDNARYFSNLTFQPNIDPENYQTAQENLIKCYKKYALQARIIVDLIMKIK